MKFYKGFWAAVYIGSGEIRAVTYAEDEVMAKTLLLSSYTDRLKALLKVEPVDVTVKVVDQYKIKTGAWIERSSANTVQVMSSDAHGQGHVTFQDGAIERTRTVVDFLDLYDRACEQ
jgi:hypothetical protein